VSLLGTARRHPHQINPYVRLGSSLQPPPLEFGDPEQTTPSRGRGEDYGSDMAAVRVEGSAQWLCVGAERVVGLHRPSRTAGDQDQGCAQQARLRDGHCAGAQGRGPRSSGKRTASSQTPAAAHRIPLLTRPALVGHACTPELAVAGR